MELWTYNYLEVSSAILFNLVTYLLFIFICRVQYTAIYVDILYICAFLFLFIN